MTQRIFVDRSRYEQFGRCPRSRWYAYHENGRGIDSVRRPLPLCVGGSIHEGLATLLREGQRSISRPDSATWLQIEDAAVEDALKDFAQYQHRLDVDVTESAGQPNPFGVGVSVASDMDDYLFAEQSALVEGLVRAYSRRRLRPLLEQFEVLEVEREGEWLLSEWKEPHDLGCHSSACDIDHSRALWFMSRPDALLLERDSRQLYLLSFKTTGAWDIRKARDAEHDMQGMSEGVEIERRLGHAWTALHHEKVMDRADLTMEVVKAYNLNAATANHLFAIDAPPRIHAVRYEYLLKGERWKDKDLSARFGVEMQSQRSHLVQQYAAVSVPMRGSAGYAPGDVCWSWEFALDDGRQSKLAWQNWKARSVWGEPGGIRAWIDRLDDAAPTMSAEDATMGLEPRLLGYKCAAQALGFTAEHPLDAVFVPPVTVYRSDDEVRDLVDQMEAAERRIAEGVAAVGAACDEGERRHQLNVHFPQTRRACEYPTTCQFSRLCYGGEDIRRDPVASGLYRIREFNHPVEGRK